MNKVNSLEEQLRTNKEMTKFLAGNSGLHEAYDKLDEEHRTLKDISTDTTESLDKDQRML